MAKQPDKLNGQMQAATAPAAAQPQLQSFTLIHRTTGQFWTIDAASLADAKRTIAEMFANDLAELPKPESKINPVNRLLGKVNANKLHGCEPLTLRMVGVNGNGQPIYNHKPTGWFVRNKDGSLPEYVESKICELPSGELLPVAA